MTVFTPINCGFDSTLWTTEIVQSFIKQNFSVDMSRSAISRLLHCIDLTPQRPAYRSIKQNPAAVEQWINKEFKKIKKLALENGASIFFLDEAKIRTDYHARTTWGLKGLTPIIPTSGDRHGVNMIAAVGINGEMHFNVDQRTFNSEVFNSEVFIEYLKDLSKVISTPIWIITDRCSVHRSNMVKKYLEENKEKIKIFFIPAYSPELNPVELVWGNIESHGFARALIHGVNELVEKATTLLDSLKRMPEKILAFFKKESLQYILKSVA